MKYKDIVKGILADRPKRDKGLATEQKQKLDPGLVYRHMFLDYYLPVLGPDNTHEMFWIGRDMGMKNGCFIVYFMNNYRYFDSETGKYKLKCRLCIMTLWP